MLSLRCAHCGVATNESSPWWFVAKNTAKCPHCQAAYQAVPEDDGEPIPLSRVRQDAAPEIRLQTQPVESADAREEEEEHFDNQTMTMSWPAAIAVFAVGIGAILLFVTPGDGRRPSPSTTSGHVGTSSAEASPSAAGGSKADRCRQVVAKVDRMSGANMGVRDSDVRDCVYEYSERRIACMLRTDNFAVLVACE